MNLCREQEVTWRGTEAYNRNMGITLPTFGERVSWLLKRPEHGNGMSQKELAAAMKISSQYLSTLMNPDSGRGPNVRHLRAAADALHTSVSFLAMASDDPSPDAVGDERVMYISPQADEAAQLIDAMRDNDLRDIAVDLLRVLAMHDGGDVDPSYTSGGASGRLILGKMLGNLKKASDAPRATTRANSE